MYTDEAEALLGRLSAGTLRLVIGDLKEERFRAERRVVTDLRPGGRESAIADRDECDSMLVSAKNALEAAK